MEGMVQSFDIVSNQKLEFINITQLVQNALLESTLFDGLAVVYVPHTTAGITINESADPSVEMDILKDLQRLIPVSQDYYKHFEGNSASHTMASLIGSSVSIIVETKKLILGRWQGIFFCEFDGPRSRYVYLQCIPT
jgi:secondary thiamine-phosphate synthase enzyme